MMTVGADDDQTTFIPLADPAMMTIGTEADETTSIPLPDPAMMTFGTTPPPDLLAVSSTDALPTVQVMTHIPGSPPSTFPTRSSTRLQHVQLRVRSWYLCSPYRPIELRKEDATVTEYRRFSQTDEQ